jgi:hypothetical protein
VWLNKQVDDRYQNHFLVYLDTLSNKDAEAAIAKEIKLTLENKSHFFKIASAMADHANIIDRLSDALDEIQNAKDSIIIDMKYFVSLLDELRNSNL